MKGSWGVGNRDPQSNMHVLYFTNGPRATDGWLESRKGAEASIVWSSVLKPTALCWGQVPPHPPRSTPVMQSCSSHNQNNPSVQGPDGRRLRSSSSAAEAAREKFWVNAFCGSHSVGYFACP